MFLVVDCLGYIWFLTQGIHGKLWDCTLHLELLQLKGQLRALQQDLLEAVFMRNVPEEKMWSAAHK